MTFYLFHLWSELIDNLTANDASFIILDCNFSIIAMFPLGIFRGRIQERWNDILEIKAVINVGWDNQYSWPIMILNKIKSVLSSTEVSVHSRFANSLFHLNSHKYKGLDQILLFYVYKSEFWFLKTDDSWNDLLTYLRVLEFKKFIITKIH